METMAKEIQDEKKLLKLLTLAKKTRRVVAYGVHREAEFMWELEQYKKEAENFEVNSGAWKVLGYLMLGLVAALIATVGVSLSVVCTGGALGVVGMWAINKGRQNLFEEANQVADELIKNCN